MSHVPAPDTPLDQWASDVTGFLLEDLSGITASQPYTSDGPWVSAAGCDLLVELAQRNVLRRSVRRDHPAEIQALVDAGLITTRGRLTYDGEFLVSPLRAAAAQISVAAQHGRRSSGLQIHVGARSSLVSAGPSAHRLRQPGAGPTDRDAEPDDGTSTQLELVDNEAVPEVVGRWMGLGPAWSFGVEPADMPAETLEARFVDDTTPPPPGANDHFHRMWNEPWVVFDLSMEPGDFRVMLVNAGVAGFHTCGQVGDDIGLARLRPLPSAAMWGMLVEQLQHAVSAHYPRS